MCEDPSYEAISMKGDLLQLEWTMQKCKIREHCLASYYEKVA